MAAMSDEKEQALVLEIREYRETSLLVTLLTRTRGLVGAVAKGARRSRGVAGTLQPYSLIEVRLAGRGGLFTLASAEILHQPEYCRCEGALERLAYAGVYAEVLSGGAENDPHSHELFGRARQFFEDLEATTHPGSFALWHLFGLLSALGYAPRIDNMGDASPRGDSLGQRRYFDLLGGVLRSAAEAAGPRDFSLTEESARALDRIVSDEPERVLVNRRVGYVLLRLAMALFETHLERQLRSRKFLEEMVLEAQEPRAERQGRKESS